MPNGISEKTNISLRLVFIIVTATVSITIACLSVNGRLSILENKVDRIMAHLEIEDKLVKN